MTFSPSATANLTCLENVGIGLLSRHGESSFAGNQLAMPSLELREAMLFQKFHQ